jgi:Arc/MetJ-type ribon-helix-helix transcriptional regulator
VWRLPVPAERSTRDLQRTSVMLPVEQRTSLQQIADRRFLSLSDTIREAISEKLARERDEVVHGR